jgi:hypothetical protein
VVANQEFRLSVEMLGKIVSEDKKT